MALAKSRYLLAPVVSAAALAVSVSAHAQSIAWRSPTESAARYADDQRPSYNDSRRIAYDEGNREGMKEGEKDARRGEAFYFQDEKEFRDADRGYHRNYGDRERYRQSFRTGYASGYDEGYRRSSVNGRNGNGGWGTARPGVYGNRGYGGYGNGGYRNGRYGYYTPAYDNGARDGFEKGQEDIRKNRSFDPLRHSWYRSGDRHYEREYGSRDEYKNLYRRGFQEGYDRAYREGRYYGW